MKCLKKIILSQSLQDKQDKEKDIVLNKCGV